MSKYVLAAVVLCVPAAASAEWKVHKSAAGKFQVELPAPPNVSEQSLTSFDPQKKTVYSVNYSELPKDLVAQVGAETYFDTVRDGLLSAAGPDVKATEAKLKKNGHPGREIVIRKGDKVTQIYGLLLVENRLYQIFAIGVGGQIDPADAGRFFKSFRPTP